jgi:1,2-diacylglycerol 3-alpha-glucosyltransferase
VIVTLVIDTFNVNNNGTTVSAMRFAATLIARGHTVRVVACGEPGDATGHGPDEPQMFFVPELVVPIASRLAHGQNTLFAKPVPEVLTAAIRGADVVHIYQPWPLGQAAERIARRAGVPAVAAFHIQPENVTYNIGLGWFRPAAHLVYVLLRLAFYGRFADIHCPSAFIAAQLRRHGYRARLHVISNGVDDSFRPGPARARETDEPFRILMIGRFSPEKRQDVLIRAVRRSRHAARIQVHFAGQGPQEKRLRRMSSRLANPARFGHYSQGERGAFHLAARARVPVVPLSIRFTAPTGRMLRRKPTMVIVRGEPIDPTTTDPRHDQRIRMELARRRMHDLIARAAS